MAELDPAISSRMERRRSRVQEIPGSSPGMPEVVTWVVKCVGLRCPSYVSARFARATIWVGLTKRSAISSQTSVVTM